MGIKQQRKVDLVNIHDYPKEQYCAYWQIGVDGDDDGGYIYRVLFFSFDNNDVLDDVSGPADTRDEADTLAQTYVLDNIGMYKRPVPIKRVAVG